MDEGPGFDRSGDDGHEERPEVDDDVCCWPLNFNFFVGRNRSELVNAANFVTVALVMGSFLMPRGAHVSCMSLDWASPGTDCTPAALIDVVGLDIGGNAELPGFFDYVVTIMLLLVGSISGSLNSRRNSGVKSAFFSFCAAFYAFGFMATDSATCLRSNGELFTVNEEFYCGRTPVAEFFVQNYALDLNYEEFFIFIEFARGTRSSVDYHASACGSEPGDILDPANWTNMTAACTSVVGSNATCGNPKVMYCACREVDECLTSYWSRHTTVVTSWSLTLAQAGALVGTVLELMAAIGLEANCCACSHSADKLLNVLPLTLFVCWLLNLIWVIGFWSPALGILRNFMLIQLETTQWSLKAVSFIINYFAVMHVCIVTVAAFVNVRRYLRHSAALAIIPWDCLRGDVDVRLAIRAPPGLNLEKLRKSSYEYIPYYIGSVSATIWLASIAFSFALTVVVAFFVLMAVKPIQPFLIGYIIMPLYGKGAAIAVLIVSMSCFGKMNWGNPNFEARNPGGTAFWNMFNTGRSFSAWVPLAFSRIVKAFILTFFGLLLVTGTTTSLSTTVLEDTNYKQYLALLKVERLRDESAGGRRLRDPHAADFSHGRTCFKAFVIIACVVAVYPATYWILLSSNPELVSNWDWAHRWSFWNGVVRALR